MKNRKTRSNVSTPSSYRRGYRVPGKVFRETLAGTDRDTEMIPGAIIEKLKVKSESIEYTNFEQSNPHPSQYQYFSAEFPKLFTKRHVLE